MVVGVGAVLERRSSPDGYRGGGNSVDCRLPAVDGRDGLRAVLSAQRRPLPAATNNPTTVPRTRDYLNINTDPVPVSSALVNVQLGSAHAFPASLLARKVYQ